MNNTTKLLNSAVNTLYKDEKMIFELVEALDRLVCCNAFNSLVFKDKEVHVAWTLARHTLTKAKEYIK